MHLCILIQRNILQTNHPSFVMLSHIKKKPVASLWCVNGIETDDSKANKIKQTKSKRKNSFDNKDVCELFFNTERKATTREDETMLHH